MTNSLDEIVHNAQHGRGPCAGCPAHEDTQGEYVNPGLLNYDADLMFVTMDPSHGIDWDRYDSWAEYNEVYSRRFAGWRGGKAIAEMLEPIDCVSLEDVWLADSIKCPVDNALWRFDDRGAIDRAFDHCREYFVQEVAEVDPSVIVTLGEDAAVRTLDMLFDIDVGALKTGTRDCGRVFDIEPPVVASPHWSHGWLGRSPNGIRNLEIVRDALVDVYRERTR